MKNFVRTTSKIAVCLLLVLVCVVLFSCQYNTWANKRRHINSINHRGYNDAPENTLAAFRLSKEMGFNMVECDVRFTKDNHPVILHDASVNRTSNGKGKIAEMTLEEVRQLDFGSWKSEQYAGELIPTFEEFIDLCVELELHPYIELKNGVTAERAQILAKIVNDAEISVTWISFQKETISTIAQQCPNARVGLLTRLITDEDLRFLKKLSKNIEVFIDCKYTALTEDQIKLCKRRKIPLEVWTVNSENLIPEINPYITGVTSDCVNAQKIFNEMD